MTRPCQHLSIFYFVLLRITPNISDHLLISSPPLLTDLMSISYQLLVARCSLMFRDSSVGNSHNNSPPTHSQPNITNHHTDWQVRQLIKLGGHTGTLTTRWQGRNHVKDITFESLFVIPIASEKWSCPIYNSNWQVKAFVLDWYCQ